MLEKKFNLFIFKIFFFFLNDFLGLCLTAEGWNVCCGGVHATSALQGDHSLHCLWHHAGRHPHPQWYIVCVRVVCMCVWAAKHGL